MTPHFCFWTTWRSSLACCGQGGLKIVVLFRRSLLARLNGVVGGLPVPKVVLILTALWLAVQAGRFPRTWFALILGGYILLGVFFYSFFRPQRALLLYLGALPFLPLYVGVELPFLHQVPAPRAVGAVVLVGVLLGLSAQGKKSPLRSPLLWISMPYMVDLVLVQRLLLAGGSITDSLLRAPFWLFVDTLGPALLVSVCAQDESWIRSLLRALFVSGAIAALLAVYESLSGTNLFAALPWQLSESGTFNYIRWPTRFGFTRAVGAVAQPSYLGWLFATLLVTAMSAYAYAWPRHAGVRWHTRGILIVVLLAFGLFVTASGVPFLSMLAGMGVLILLQPRMLLHSRTGSLLFLLLVLLLALPFSSQITDLWGSFLGISASQRQDSLVIQGNMAGRLQLPSLTWSLIEESFIFGHGTLSASGVWNVAKDITNRYVLELVNGGLVGLLLWIMPIALAMWRTWLNYRQSMDAERKALALAMLSALVVGLAVFYGISFGHQAETLFWVVVGVAWALPLQNQTKESSRNNCYICPS